MAAWLWWAVGPAAATDGTVTMPLASWLAVGGAPPAPDGPGVALPIGRTLVGGFDRGLVSAVLTSRLVVRGTEVIPVPVVGTDATLVSARLDGRPAALRDEGGTWTVDAGPGPHELRVELLQGAVTDRFARRIAVRLPPGGPTQVDLVVPEAPIEAVLAGGVLADVIPGAGSTRLLGWLDASGALDLTWERASAAALDAADARLEARIAGVVTLGDDVVTGLARFDMDVREGEIDRLTFRMPPELEVLDVTGPSVLQWHTADDGGPSLVVLLRGIADERVDATVAFQYPSPADAPVAVRVPIPAGSVPFVGAVGVDAPVGLDVTVGDPGGTRPLEARDVPQEILALTERPLRAVLAFDHAVDATLAVARQPDVDVSTTRIDDLQAITVLVEDGTEVGKLLLSVRNTTRQVLTVDLPPGSRLTHCFRDGVPLRPAADAARPERILVPLTRSERPPDGTVTHVVEAGDMLSTIALRYYGDGGAWGAIAAANEGIATNLQVGQVIVVPGRGDQLEAAFALEIGWERRADRFGPVGARAVSLPALDLDVMAANWHLYLPDSVEPLWLDGRGPIQRVGALHRDPITRVFDALVSVPALSGAVAYAGESYENALDNRRKVYDMEQRKDALVGADPFPLIGAKYRLRGVLLGVEPASARVIWLGRGAADAVRAGAGLAGIAAALLALWRPAGEGRAMLRGGAAGLLVGALVVAHYVRGAHGPLMWGLDAGLLGMLALRWFQGGAPLRWARPRLRTVLAAGAVVAVVAVTLVASEALLPVWIGVGLAALLWRSA